MQPYNPLDYRYTYNVPKETLNRLHLQGTITTVPVTLPLLLAFVHTNDNAKGRISQYINSHEQYLDGLQIQQRNIVHLWTNPEIAAALQRILRGIGQNGSRDLDRLTAILELNNSDIHHKADRFRSEIMSNTNTQQQKDSMIRDMLMFVLDRFVLSLTTIMFRSPSIPFVF